MAFKHYVGIDWASDSYQVCVIDNNVTVIGEKKVEHSGDGIRECIDWLLKLDGLRPGNASASLIQY